jgi:hypothetical protein
MTIHPRNSDFTQYTTGFTIIGNDCLRDGDLTPEALGVFVYLRSMPPDWRVMPTQLMNHFKKCGRERIQRILNELIECGYIQKTIQRDPVTQKWKPAEYVVFGHKSAPSPETASVHREARNRPAALVRMWAEPLTANPLTADPPLLNTDLPNTDSTKEERTLAFARPRSKPADEEIDQVFEQRFWPAYPKRAGDQNEMEAKRKFRKIVKASADPQATVEAIMGAAKQYAAHWKPTVERKRSEAKFIPMAVNWLNDRRWEGAPPEGAEDETMFDLAIHFEQRVRTTNSLGGYSGLAARLRYDMAQSGELDEEYDQFGRLVSKTVTDQHHAYA